MPLVIAVVLAFIIYSVLDVALTDAVRVRNLPKPAWLVVVVFLPVLGGIAWLLGGRPEHAGRSPGGRGGGVGRGTPGSSPRGTPPRGSSWGQAPSAPRSPPRGPDDDPEFLRHVEEQLRRDRPPDDT